MAKRRPQRKVGKHPALAAPYKGEPGVKLMQGHSPAVLGGMVVHGALMGPDEYSRDIDQRRPRQCSGCGVINPTKKRCIVKHCPQRKRK